MIGFTGPGGAGKTTLIDELVLRFLQREPKARIAILSHDPSVVGEGALARRSRHHDQFAGRSRFHAQHGDARTGRRFVARDRKLSRSPNAIRISITSLSRRSAPARKRCRFAIKLVDQTVLVMNPDYGARLQLQKIVMLDVADIVVVNKTDLDRAKAALSEIEHRLTQNKRNSKSSPPWRNVIATRAWINFTN